MWEIEMTAENITIRPLQEADEDQPPKKIRGATAGRALENRRRKHPHLEVTPPAITL
jgi:hypothetical protein